MRTRIRLTMRIRIPGSSLEQWAQVPILRTVNVINLDTIKIRRTTYHLTFDGHFAYLNWQDRQPYRMVLTDWNAITSHVTQVTPCQ